MKRLLLSTLVLLLLFFSSFFAFAHPGKTDSDGGHYNRNTGDYHYHHGYPEHEHINGKCPFGSNNNAVTEAPRIKKDKVQTTQSTTKSTTKTTTQPSNEEKTKSILKCFISNHPNITIFIIILICAFLSYIKQEISSKK